jgi:hypothetical protein
MQKNTSISATKTVVSMFDAETARVLAALFHDQMIPAEVIANGVPLRWDIQVPSEFFEHGLRLYEQWKLSDSELSLGGDMSLAPRVLAA